MTEVAVQSQFDSPSLSVRDICCRGSCAHQSAEECATAVHLVFPYRGVFVRHLGRDQAVAEANQAVVFNPHEGYRISHPIAGGDACLSLAVDEAALAEIAPPSALRGGATLAFRRQAQPIEPAVQALAARLRHALRRPGAEPLEIESLALALAQRTLGARGAQTAGAGAGPQRLAGRAKLVLAGDLARRWTLRDIAAQVGVSPVYLTQVFQRVEGLPLYRYHLRLRLARALDLLGEYDDLTALGLELGFSSHSHFTAQFRATYGKTPSQFRRGLRQA